MAALVDETPRLLDALPHIPQRQDPERDEPSRIAGTPFVHVPVVIRLHHPQRVRLVLRPDEKPAVEADEGAEAQRRGEPARVHVLDARVDVPLSIIPFLLRGVSLLGIDSVLQPFDARRKAWARLVRDLDLGLLESMIVPARLADVPELGADILKGRVRGRVVVDVNG